MHGDVRLLQLFSSPVSRNLHLGGGGANQCLFDLKPSSLIGHKTELSPFAVLVVVLFKISFCSCYPELTLCAY